jgi:carbamoyl-phosphate synthase large subunit
VRMERIDILITCANSQVMPEIVSMIRDHPDYAIKVHGTDAKRTKGNIAEFCCDRCYDVPHGSDPGYYHHIRKIVEEQGIQILFPGSDEESLALSRNQADMETLGCTICCSNSDVIALASNKYLCLQKLRQFGVPTGAFFVPDSLKDVGRISLKLGYPAHDFVIKPQLGRGSCGFRIITPTADAYKNFKEGQSHRMTIEELKTLFRDQEGAIRNFLLMEYYPGEKYSADVLVSKGKAVSMVIRNNGVQVKTNPPTQKADIVFDADVREYAARVVEIFGFDFFVQVECGRRHDASLGLIEINTRLDATLPITSGLGINFFREMITYAMSGKMRSNIPDYLEYPENLRFLRYWKHDFLRI